LVELKELLYRAEYRPDADLAILVGDMTDRGPDPVGIMRFARENNIKSVLGNHDNKYVRFRKHEFKRIESSDGKYKNPMKMSENKMAAYLQMNEEDHVWLASLPSRIHLEAINTLVVHAGIIPNRDPFDQADNVYQYCRYVSMSDNSKLVNLGPMLDQPKNSCFWADRYEGATNIVYGHNVHGMENPYVRTNSLGAKTFGIDTGCCFGGRLTGIVFKDYPNSDRHEFVQVQAARVYYGR
jgi:diadenosine tetraphosphatase ApaH/serine/threonine PP2A family protein phosphatase